MFVSADLHWQVSRITLDGRQYLRVEHDEPVIVDDGLRFGIFRTRRGWWLAGDFATVGQVAALVPLDQLQAAP